MGHQQAPIEVDDEPRSPLRAWCELFRLPNVFTAMADIFLGYWLAHETLAPWWIFLLLLAASILLYTAGMVLNDVFDEAIDRAQRPARPIPSGRVPLGRALHAGGVMLGAGVALGWTAGLLAGGLRAGVVATLLAVAIVAYDRILKRTPLAPVIMGSCRTLNILLGASTIAGAWHPMHLVVAIGVGVYITGVTWFARTEARESRRAILTAATVVMLAGLALLAWFPAWADNQIDPAQFPLQAIALGWRWYILWGVLAALAARRCGSAIVDPSPGRVQIAVKESILSLVVIDAVACFAVRGVLPATVILLLLVPIVWLGRWIYST